MTQVAPSTSFVDIFSPGETGLVGIAKFGIYQGDTVVQALSTANINEIGVLGGYVATRTSPGTAGWYQLVWSKDGSTDPDQLYFSDLYVTSDATTTIGSSGSLYISADELKKSLTLSGTTFADEDVDLAIAAACRAIDGYKRTRYYPTTETRYYSPDIFAQDFSIDDLVSVTSLSVDTAGDSTYAEEWVDGTDFYLDPPNAVTDGTPRRSIVLRRQASRQFPRYSRGIRVVGSFGWAETPPQVKQAAKILATRLVARRDVPFGIVSAGSDMVAMARIGRIDPDVAWLLDQIPGSQPSGLRSLQLG